MCASVRESVALAKQDVAALMARCIAVQHVDVATSTAVERYVLLEELAQEGDFERRSRDFQQRKRGLHHSAQHGLAF